MSGHSRVQARLGIALIEVVVAIVLLATAGTAWITFAGQSRAAGEFVREREAEIREASLVLAGIALSSSDELAQQVGAERLQGRFAIRIESSDRKMFAVSVQESSTGALLLRTQLYPEPGAMNAR